MRILVTGGFGFLGGRLAQFLAGVSGTQVRLGSRQAIGPPAWLPEADVVHSQWGDVASLERACVGVDVVVHLAGMNAEDSAADPAAALEFNGAATARLVQAATRQHVKRFVYLSTAHVYGRPLVGVLSERTCPRPVHPYATSHRAGEDAVLGARRRGEIDGVVVRLSNAFGEPAHAGAPCWGLLVNDLCRQAASSSRIVLRSTGLDRRDWVPLQEVCEALAHVIDPRVNATDDGLVNIGGEWPITVWEMAELIKTRASALMGREIILTRPAPRGDEVIPDLDYRLDVLRASGFRCVDHRMTEIDRLLKFCQAAFA